MSIIETVGRTLARWHHGERGQVLFMFLALTTVFFAVAVVAVDASAWQSQRRTAQKDADASAFAGGQELFNDTADMTSRATSAAITWAGRNGADAAKFKAGTPQVISSCFGQPVIRSDGTVRPDGVVVDLGAKGSTMFSTIWDLIGADVGAHAKVCVGSPPDAEGILPIGVQLQVSQCFDQSTTPPTPLFGANCVVEVRAPDGSSGETGILQLYNCKPTGDMNCTAAETTRCSDNTLNISNAELQNQIAYGAATSCASDSPPGASTNDCQILDPYNIGTCVWSLTGNKAKQVVEGLQTRLSLEGQTSAPYNCDDAFPDSFFGGQYVHDKVDQWWEALSTLTGDIHTVTPGPDVTFVKRACKAPRLVTIILLDRFAAQGQGPYLIRGFAAFFIAGCRDTDGNFNQRCVTQQAAQNGCGGNGCPNPTNEPLLRNTGQLNMEGMFINYVDIGARGGPLNRFGRMQLFLVD